MRYVISYKVAILGIGFIIKNPIISNERKIKNEFDLKQSRGEKLY